MLLFISGQSQSRGQVNLLLQMLHGLVSCQESLKSLSTQLSDTEEETSLQQEGETITTIIETKLQSVLLHLIKIYKVMLSKKRLVFFVKHKNVTKNTYVKTHSKVLIFCISKVRKLIKNAPSFKIFKYLREVT